MYFISRLSSVILLTWIYTEGYHDKTQKMSKNSTDALPTATTSHAPDDTPTQSRTFPPHFPHKTAVVVIVFSSKKEHILVDVHQ